MVQINQGTNKFYIGTEETSPTAEITYQKDANGNIIVEHTYVSDSLRGQGIAGQLMDRVVSHAKQEETKIIPECSYAKGYIEKNNLQDVLVD
jgi:uncharacterized protein